MTDFRKPLEHLLEAVPGALLVSIMGTDGIPIDTVQAPEGKVDASGLVVEYGALIEQVRRSAQMFAAGGLEEVAVRAENLTCIMRPINQEFFLALVLQPGASIGKSRYLLRLQAPQFEPALT